MLKVLITGCNGLLGQTLLEMMIKNRPEMEIIGVSKGENRTKRLDFVYEQVDITNYSELSNSIVKHKPDFIINTAAMTNVDACEDDKEGCFALNVTSVEYLTKLCLDHQIHLIHISTDFIFDGKKGFYKETDKPNPLSYYGWSKLKSEEIILNSKISATILRTILVYGKVHDMKRNNIVLWIREMLKNNKEVTIVNDQYRMPTYVVDLAMACLLSINNRAEGVYNVSSSELLSVYEIAIQIADAFELDSTLIKPISSETLNQKAKRPAKTGFNLEKTKRELGLVPKTFQEDLQRFKQSLV